MNSLRFLVLTMALLIGGGVYAQDNRALITIDGEDVSVDDFMYVYKKNNTQENAMDKKSIEEYLDLYINFKLKVKEAENQGLDTVQSFIDELAGYRKQLAEPYFVNDEIMEEMLEEAYERKKTDIRASHILFRVGPNAMPEDTLAAWNKAMEARKRIMDGEDFSTVAKEVSEDPSARDREAQRGGRVIPGNGGDLGYFSVFDMVYPFETGAYNLEIGELSMPIRSDFGYHIIKVTDRIPAQGSIEAAHLFLQMPEEATAADSTAIKEEAWNLYKRIQEGENFEDLVKEYSDDKGSANRGGVLPKFNVNRMVPEFIQVISQMSDSGDISEPVLTSYGWHIVKLLGKTGLQPFDEVKDDMEKRLEKDRRAQKSTEVIIRDIKNEYNYKEIPKNLGIIYDMVDSTIYEGKWSVPEDADLSKPVITLGDAEYSQQMFADFIASKQNISQQENIKEFINKKFKEFSDLKCKEYEDSRLEDKYPEFKAIVKEYRDGILLFELTNEKIWSYAGKDTVGLQNYYNEHKKDFMWDTRLDASIVTVMDTAYLDKIRALAEAGKSDDEILTEINGDSLDVVRIEHKKFQKEENKIIDGIKWKKGITENMKDKGRTLFVIVHEKVAPQPKTFDEARGLITAGYQEYLEKEWIEELRAKYPVVVHEEVLESIIE
ncbi:MAG: peptidyl-prolyl cis-trans isomerase [Bacteroidetes bacterium]|nr:peptidyl-prolyl cis-trans isomerase [Bacteroidota bacterium]